MALKKAKKRAIKKPVKKVARKKLKKVSKKSVKKSPLKKRVVKKTAAKKQAKKQAKKKVISKEKNANLLGIVTHYFPHVQAAVIKLSKPLINGDKVKIQGHTSDLTQVVSSMQIDRVEIQPGKKGDEIGLKVNSRVRQGDKVYKI